MDVLGMIVIGLVAGALARLLVPGRDEMGIIATTLLGIVGAVVGGGLARVLFDDTSVGLVGSTVGAIIVLLVYRAVTGSRRTA